jgi:hypothetical protein
VTTPVLAAPPLAQPEDLAVYLQRDLDRSTAELALVTASAVVRRYCGWVLTETTETTVVHGDGTRLLRLPTLRLTDVADVQLFGQSLTATDWVTAADMAEDEYTWTYPGLLLRANPWPYPAPVTITYTHGYTDLPADIPLVALAFAARTVTNPEGARVRTVGVVAATYPDPGAGLTAAERALLDGYAL